MRGQFDWSEGWAIIGGERMERFTRQNRQRNESATAAGLLFAQPSGLLVAGESGLRPQRALNVDRRSLR